MKDATSSTPPTQPSTPSTPASHIRFATEAEIAAWDDLLVAGPRHGYVLQAKPFSVVKAADRWTPRFIIIDDTRPALLIEKVVWGLGRIWYFPKGPVATDADDLANLLPAIRSFARAHGVFVVKVEPELHVSEEARILASGLVPTGNVQMATSTIIVDITKDTDTLFAEASPKLRHGVRKAATSGVEPHEVPVTDESIRQMHALMAETAASAGFPARPLPYYQRFWGEYAAAGLGHMFFSRHDGSVVTAAYVILLGDTAYYKDGASTRSRSAYGTSDALQWYILTWLKEHHPEITRYDMMGCPPSDRIDDSTHPLFGVGSFKKKVSKNIVDYTGTYDLPIRPRRLALWNRWVKKIAYRIHWTRFHETYF